MKEVTTTTKVLAITAVIIVSAVLVTLPYQNQVANAAPTRKYNVDVTLTDVPANAGDLIMNVTIIRSPLFIPVSETQIKTVSSPSDGDTVNFAFRVPAGSNENSVAVCGNTADFTLSACDIHSLPSKPGNSPIRMNVDYTPRPPF
jgi:hypothetical protein